MQRNNAAILLIAGLILFLFLPTQAADIIINGQNQLRYARGTQADNEDESYGYLENYLELNASINKFRLYLRQGYRIPSEFEYYLTGLESFDKRYIEYNDDYLTVRGGTFYDTWGQGLLFGNIELLEIDTDTGLEGVIASARYNGFDATIFRGVEVDSTDEVAEGAEGAYLGYSSAQHFTLPFSMKVGGSLVRLDEGKRHPVINRYGLEVDLEVGAINLYSGYMEDKLEQDFDKYHHGFYSALTGYGGGFGLLVEYKNYKLFSQSEKLALQYPPTAIPEITMHLLDSHPRTVRFWDDVGYQVELTYTHGDMEFLLNFNQSSEHEEENSLMPVFQEEYSPYQAAFLNFIHDAYMGNRYVFHAGWHENVNFTPTANGGYSTWFERIGFGGTYEHEFADIYTGSIDLQLMKVQNRGFGKTIWEEYFGLTLTRYPEYSFTLAFERTEDLRETGGIEWTEDLPGGSGRYWINGELTVDFWERHQARIFVGHERGGLRCSGGSCRFVNPFKGVKLTLISQF